MPPRPPKNWQTQNCEVIFANDSGMGFGVAGI